MSFLTVSNDDVLNTTNNYSAFTDQRNVLKKNLRSKLLLLVGTLVRAVCLNHEVAMFQPRIGTDPVLGSIAIITTFMLVSSCPTCFNRFLDLSAQ